MAHLLFGGGFLVTSLAGLTGWWSADYGVYSDAGTTLAVDTNTVQQWNDRSGNGRNFSQGTAGFRPTYRTGILNAQPVLRFGGGTDDDFMEANAMSTFFASQAKTVFFVSKWNANAVSCMLGSDNASDRFIVAHSASGGDAIVTNNDGALDTVTSTTPVAGSYHIYLAMHDSSNISIGVNDSRTASLTTQASGATNALTPLVRIGYRNTGAPTQLDGDIAEAIFFNVVLAEVDRTSIDRYLAAKYNITLPY